MKIVIGLFAVIGVIGYFVFTSSDFSNFDPSQQGRDARAAISVGMSWDQVAEAAGTPLKYRPLQKAGSGPGADQLGRVKVGPELKFTEGGLQDRLTQGTLPHGFVIDYVFSQSVAFRVTFDSKGQMTGAEDLVTMADMLQMRD